MKSLLVLLLFLPLAVQARADAGVLIPGSKDAPDPAVLSLEEMTVDVTIDGSDALVSIVEIFANHTRQVQEGTYAFSLPNGSSVSDFAVWDGPVRIPAVILERRRAQELYEETRLQAIDPGLLQMGERDDEASRTALFSARIVPIPAFGTKRLELEYRQRLPVNSFKQVFSLPLKPSLYHEQRAKHLSVHLHLQSSHSLEGFSSPSAAYHLKLGTSSPHRLEADYVGTDVSFSEDLTATWSIKAAEADQLQVISFRDPAAPLPQPDERAPLRSVAPEPGFFKASTLIGGRASDQSPADTGPPRTFVLLFDNSFSMQWEKLERSFAVLEGLLRSLRPSDQFNVVLFNADVTPFRPRPIPADATAIQAALNFVRASHLRGGTDLGKALSAGLGQSVADGTNLILLTDGGSDRGESVLTPKIAARYQAAWKQAAHRPRTDVFAVGDDANLPLLRLLASNNGVLESVLSTEPVDYKLSSFLDKITHSPVSGLSLSTPPQARQVYALDDAVYPGSVSEWVGQYTSPVREAHFAVHSPSSLAPGHSADVEANVSLPEKNLDHPQLPRLWAQARVAALLDEIAREGESREAIDEIIRLSRRYKLVTPYTSFLAVPRALLRPRVIRPGDPVLRVRTDPAITSVIALFPFGLTKPLRHLSSEDKRGENGGCLWETRFLAPPEMKDGTYSVRLIFRDLAGNTYREAKTFVIASTPPTVRIHLNRQQFHRGDPVLIQASASASTRTLVARLEGAAPVSLRWNPASRASSGTIAVPDTLPIGRYSLTVTAEDIAHNLGSQEVEVDVIP